MSIYLLKLVGLNKMVLCNVQCLSLKSQSSPYGPSIWIIVSPEAPEFRWFTLAAFLCYLLYECLCGFMS